MKEMLTFLSSLRKTYYLYIGDGDLIAFKHFIDGYIMCLRNTDQLDHPELYEEFCNYVEKHYQFDNTSTSIYRKIKQYTDSSSKAFSTFFDFLDDFIALKQS